MMVVQRFPWPLAQHDVWVSKAAKRLVKRYIHTGSAVDLWQSYANLYGLRFANQADERAAMIAARLEQLARTTGRKELR